jgi:hypothetical protein
VWPFEELLWLAVIGLFLAIGARRFPSVWRRKQVEQRRKKEEQTRVLTASAALERVRKQLEERNRPAPQVFSSHYASPPPPPAAPKPAEPRPARPAEPAKQGDASLLSAMRKVRKQLEDRRDDS